MAEKISFEIEDAQELLNQLQKLNEIFQQDWSRVLNQWGNIKTTWQDKQAVVFEAQFQKILSIYQCSGKECEEYIVEIKRQIEIARKHQQIPLPPEFTNTRSNPAQTPTKRDQIKTSSPASKEASTNLQIPHSEIKNTPAAIQNDVKREQASHKAK
ncbi:hypothetical protein NIES4071_40070 [Calothrix sp. NIES-4071]|nr:hypothetical protein NIES4071_40070 [Calothrix sp. NIES-4071]BAZ58325.1 hypothetical protein NIES4105_40010 [Calothrix sp. NIES-4105]